MGLASFRVRVFLALAMVLVIWQSARIWRAVTDDPSLSEEVREDAENGNLSSKIQRVLITVYYEALCPDSRSFVIKQLEPTYQTLRENVQIQMVPYGKATTTTTSDGYEFTCQHGPMECEENMIHACAIDIIKEPTARLEFLTCMIKNHQNPLNITKACGEKLSLDVKPILDCQMGTKGKELLAMYGKMTDELRPQVSFIPTVTLDKNTGDQRAILKNLLKEVCKLYKVLPNDCT